ncbi:hypothetical protein Bbelb_242600 [Branchiostoma belcheri]|nr:hypothetical protein Bbelb_242600 [Branchiostoma belcheri]
MAPLYGHGDPRHTLRLRRRKHVSKSKEIHMGIHIEGDVLVPVGMHAASCRMTWLRSRSALTTPARLALLLKTTAVGDRERPIIVPPQNADVVPPKAWVTAAVAASIARIPAAFRVKLQSVSRDVQLCSSVFLYQIHRIRRKFRQSTRYEVECGVVVERSALRQGDPGSILDMDPLRKTDSLRVLISDSQPVIHIEQIQAKPPCQPSSLRCRN